MLKKLAIAFGAIFLGVGILGFIPAAAPNEHLLGIFHVNTAHNLVHVASGFAALVCGLMSEHASRLFFRTFGIVYGLVALLGSIGGDRPILGFLSNNLADTWLHAVIAAASLVIGFAVRQTSETLAESKPSA